MRGTRKEAWLVYHVVGSTSTMASLSSFAGFFSNTLPRVGRRLLQWRGQEPGTDTTNSSDGGVSVPQKQRPHSAGCSKSEPSANAGSHYVRLHHPRDSKGLVDFLKKRGTLIDVNEVDEYFRGAPIHSIIRQASTDDSRHAADCLVALLTYSNADINLPDREGNTPLHIAVKTDNLECAEVLLAFRADPNALNRDGATPLDVATAQRAPVYLKTTQRQTSRDWTYVSTQHNQQPPSFPEDIDNGTIVSELHNLLTSVGGKHAEHSIPTTINAVEREEGEGESPFPEGFDLELHYEVDKEEEDAVKRKPETKLRKVTSGCDLTSHERRVNYNMGSATRKLYHDMEDNIKKKTNTLLSLHSFDEMSAIQMQRKELVRYRATGARILSLDGGGMKGLIEIDVLEQLEQETGKKVPELFDWIVATSTGAIIILGLLYAKKSLQEIRQLYYRLKDDVFASPRFGMAYNTSALEELLVDLFGTEMTMAHDSHNMPKVIITAVNKKNKTPELRYFSNCFNDNLCQTPVWKVARCSSAAPLLFEEFEDHVDGGVLANNPCQVGLLRIEEFHQARGEKLPVSLVVSLGSGTYPPKQLGSINARQYLYFGTHWLNLIKQQSLPEIRNLAELLSNAGNSGGFPSQLVESETTARTTQHQCEERGIAFHRISPTHGDIIVASETSNDKLCHMVVSARAKSTAQIGHIAQTLTNCVD